MYLFKISLALLLFISPLALSSQSADDCIRLFNAADFSKARIICQQAAEQGDAVSQSALGEMYDQGDGVTENQKLADKWWSRAAANAYLPAQNLLAMKYYYGGDVFQKQPYWKQDYEKAFEIWKKSAFRSTATSQFMLGVMYQNGQGVKTDYAESFAWFKIALEGGYKLATDSLIELSRVITPEQKRLGAMRIIDLKQEIDEMK